MGRKGTRMPNPMFFPSNILYSQCLYCQVKKNVFNKIKTFTSRTELKDQVPTVISSGTTRCHLRTIITYHYCRSSDNGKNAVDGTFRGLGVLYKFYLS